MRSYFCANLLVSALGHEKIGRKRQSEPANWGIHRTFAASGWAILVILSVSYLPAIGTPDFHWESLVLTVGLCIAGVIGAVGLNAMRVYLFWGGKRLVPRRTMIVFCAVAIGVLATLAALSLPGMLGDTADYFGVVYIIPLLTALHILWVGRSYFTGGANKPLQSTCEDARA